MKKLKRRPRLSQDILLLLERLPNLTQAQITAELFAKPHSIKAVLWKLVHRELKIIATKAGVGVESLPIPVGSTPRGTIPPD